MSLIEKKKKSNRTCFVPGCSSGYKSNLNKVTLFSTPKDQELFKKWQNVIPRADKALDKLSVVCALHFDERFIERNYSYKIKGEDVVLPRTRPCLTADAFPTVFPNLPSYLSKKLPIERNPKTRNRDPLPLERWIKIAPGKEMANCVWEWDEESKKKYLEKLEYHGVCLPDPLDDDLRLRLYKPCCQRNSPNITFGDIYIFLVETVQLYTREDFKYYKGLDCFKIALSGKTQDILSYKCNSTQMCVLTCDIQTDETISSPYRTWVAISLTGVVQSCYCTCMDESMKACVHVAALLLSLEEKIKKEAMYVNSGVSSFEKSSQSKSWVELSHFLEDKYCEKENISKNKNASSSSFSDYKQRLRVIKKIVPNAPIFTLLCDSDLSSSDEEEICEMENDQSQTSNNTLTLL